MAQPRHARPGVLALAVGLAAWALARLTSDALPAVEGEPLALRWLRTAADHPGRTTAALALWTWALLPHRSAPADRPVLPGEGDVPHPQASPTAEGGAGPGAPRGRGSGSDGL